MDIRLIVPIVLLAVLAAIAVHQALMTRRRLQRAKRAQYQRELDKAIIDLTFSSVMTPVLIQAACLAAPFARRVRGPIQDPITGDVFEHGRWRLNDGV